MKRFTFLTAVVPAAALLLATACTETAQDPMTPQFGKTGPGGANGTTLAGYKTIDICSVSETTWRYSGVIAVWNEGAIATEGLSITDFIEYQTGRAFVKAFDIPVALTPSIIPAGTTMATAITYRYSTDGTPLAGTIRNNASLTITNHSGSLGTAKGPNPKATFTGTVQPCANVNGLGCSYSQGYWGSKPSAVWPAQYSRTASFFSSGQTWQEVMDMSGGSGYYQLAHQYIAALLNQANGASVPDGIQATLDLATAWLTVSGPGACAKGGSCGMQKDWAATLELYNTGMYPGGPAHCGDE